MMIKEINISEPEGGGGKDDVTGRFVTSVSRNNWWMYNRTVLESQGIIHRIVKGGHEVVMNG